MSEVERMTIIASIELSETGFTVLKCGEKYQVTQSSRAAAIMMNAIADIDELLETLTKPSDSQ
ncbi:hypothetical protein ACOI22_02770 [Glaciecola sp. 2405UD65-10]|uniref:hypothetical protein n=1 Tax=Glaciecola sp. 2405UD65-10 TaxID=3397244 RepID=UPI003B590275